jgi:hypothetical protein
MKHILAGIAALGILCYGSFGIMASAADSSLPINPEDASISKIFKMIGGVNLKQSDAKTQQTFQDFLEWKNQIYQPKAVSSRPATTSARPPSPLKKAF